MATSEVRATPGGSETAAAIAVTALPTARAAETAAEVWAGLRGRRFDALDAVYVADSRGLLTYFLAVSLLL